MPPSKALPASLAGRIEVLLVLLLSLVIPATAAVYREESPSKAFPQQNIRNTMQHKKLTRRLQEDLPVNTTTTSSTTRRHLRFAVIPKSVDNAFFAPVQDGCMDQAQRFSDDTGDGASVECLFVGPSAEERSGAAQAQILSEMLFPANASNNSAAASPSIDGVAISVQDENRLAPLLKRAREELQLPIITFDSDLEGDTSLRQYYIGTNNTFFGRQLARAMEMLHPNGGTYGIIGGTSPNLQARVDGLLSELNHATNHNQNWTPLPGSPLDARNNMTLALQQMEQWAHTKPAVIVSVRGLPMRVVADPITNQSTIPFQTFVDEHNPDNEIILLCGDAMAHQLALLEANYVAGLVGQVPYDMGAKSMDTLYTMVTDPKMSQALLGDPVSDEDATPTDFIGTNVVSHIHIPLRLPAITVDHNLIGNLKYVGFSLFGIIVVLGLSCGIWAFVYRNVRVVRVAQPRFLIMIALGVTLMASCMIPLSLDDGGGTSRHCVDDGMGFGEHCTLICMSVPWCASMGFTIAFSALYSKTRRVNKIFHSDSAFGRVKVSERDVLVPFFVLLSLNLLILILWTILDPMVYTRVADYGRDGWNRVISTHGECSSDTTPYYLIPLAIVNAGVLMLANWQCYVARDIVSEFAETKYIGICMGSLLQAGITGVPVLVISRDNPSAYYLVATLFVFIVCVVILGSIFVPKMMFARQYMAMSDQSKNQFMIDMISKTAKASKVRLEASCGADTDSSPMPSSPFGRLSLPSFTKSKLAQLSIFGSGSNESRRTSNGERNPEQNVANSNPNTGQEEPSFSSSSDDDGLMFMRKSVTMDTSSGSIRIQRLSFPNMDSSSSHERRKRSTLSFVADMPCSVIEEGDSESENLSVDESGEPPTVEVGTANLADKDLPPEETVKTGEETKAHQQEGAVEK